MFGRSDTFHRVDCMETLRHNQEAAWGLAERVVHKEGLVGCLSDVGTKRHPPTTAVRG